MNYCKYDILFWLLVAAIVFLSACNTDTTSYFDQHFDAAEYIYKEKDAILKQHQTYANTVILNGVKETVANQTLDSVNLQEMVDLFVQANINKKIFKDEYEIDTFWIKEPNSNDQIEVVNFTTTNDNLLVKWFQEYSNGSMKAMLSKKNFLYSYEKEIYYHKEQAFSIVSWQKTLGQDTLKVFNKMEFLN